MSINSRVEVKERYLYVWVTGVYNLAESLDGLKKTLETAAACHVTRILIDGLGYTGTPSTTDYFRIGEFIAKEVVHFAMFRGVNLLRIAFVFREPLLDREHFDVLVASNRGADAWSFENVPDALKWLGVDGAGGS